MGNLFSPHAKVAPLPVTILVQRINDCIIPDDKNEMLDYIEMIDVALCEKTTTEQAAQQLKDSDGMLLLLKLLKRMIEDPAMVQTCLTLFTTIKSMTPLVMDLIQYGGLDLLEKIIRLYAADDYISSMAPKLLKLVLAVGAKASITEIQSEGLNLQLCQSCQEIIERAKKSQFTIAKIRTVRSCDRVNRVLRFMDNYLQRVDVQAAALDAILNFVRNPDAVSQLKDTQLVRIVCKSIEYHGRESAVIWRACLVLSFVAQFGEEVAIDIAGFNVHEVIAETYHYFAEQESNKLVQQQILWLLASYLYFHKSSKIIQRSERVMKFFRRVIDESEAAAAGIDPTEVVDQRAVDEKLYAVAIPLKIRTFLRETRGAVHKDKAPPQVKKVFAQRRNFDERPKFGTVVDKHFTEGNASGLIARSGDSDDEAKKVPEWEQALTYGKKKEKKKKGNAR